MIGMAGKSDQIICRTINPLRTDILLQMCTYLKKYVKKLLKEKYFLYPIRGRLPLRIQANRRTL